MTSVKSVAMTLFLLITFLLTITAIGLPTDSNALSENSPQTVTAKLLQLVFEEAERIRQREIPTKEVERERMGIQEKDGPRHDRAWAISKKEDGKRDKQSSS